MVRSHNKAIAGLLTIGCVLVWSMGEGIRKVRMILVANVIVDETKVQQTGRYFSVTAFTRTNNWMDSPSPC